MKRIISLILALSLLLSFGVYASEKDLLLSSGIIPSATSANGYVSRGMFAEMMISLINMDELTGEVESAYSDIDSSSDMGKAVNTLTSMNIMSGYEDGTFRPERLLKVSEAVKIMVHLLGYGYKANSYGGYPTGYMYLANELKLMNDVSGTFTDDISYDSAVTLIYNALDVPLSRVNGVGDNLSYVVEKGVTLLSVYHNMAKGKGIVTGIDSAALSGYFETGDSEKIRIGNDVYFVKGISAAEYIGLNVDFIYEIDENSDEKTIVYIEANSKNKIEEINMSDYSGINGNEILYEDGDKLEKVSFSLNADVIFNGMNGVISKSVLDGIEEGVIRLVSTKNNSVYDLVIIKSYKDIIVGRIDNNNKTVYDEIDANRALNLDSSERTVKLFDASGNETSFQIISVGDVLTVIESEKYVEAYITAQSVSGILQSCAEIDGTLVITIGEKEIALNKTLAQKFNVSAGENLRVTLNYFGKGVKTKTLSKEGFDFYYLVKLAGKSNGPDEKVFVKLFHSEKGLGTYNICINLNMNGKLLKNVTAEKISKEMNGDTETLIGVKFDEAGNISQIITPKSLKELVAEGQDGFTKTHELTARRYGEDPPQFARSFMVKKNTPVMQIPKNIEKAADDEFMMRTVDSFEPGDIYCEAYNSTVDYGIPEFIVYRPESGAASVPAFKLETALVIVKDIAKVIDEDGAPTTKYTVQNGSSEKYFYYDGKELYDEVETGVKFNVSDLSKGDIIRYSVDNANYIGLLDVFYDYSADKWYNLKEFTTTGYAYTKIEKVVDNYVYFTSWWKDTGDLYSVVDITEKTSSLGGIGVIEHRDSGIPNVTGGSSADALAGHDVLVHMAYGQFIGLIIFR